MSFTVVSQAHEARLDGPVATADTKVAVGFTVHVRKGSQLSELLPGFVLVLDIWDVTSQDRSWRERCAALRAVVHTHVVELIPVDLDTLQAVCVTTGYGDWVSESIST